MRNDVIRHGRSFSDPGRHACRAKRVGLQKRFRCAIPPGIVTTFPSGAARAIVRPIPILRGRRERRPERRWHGWHHKSPTHLVSRFIGIARFATASHGGRGTGTPDLSTDFPRKPQDRIKIPPSHCQIHKGQIRGSLRAGKGQINARKSGGFDVLAHYSGKSAYEKNYSPRSPHDDQAEKSAPYGPAIDFIDLFNEKLPRKAPRMRTGTCPARGSIITVKRGRKGRKVAQAILGGAGRGAQTAAIR